MLALEVEGGGPVVESAAIWRALVLTVPESTETSAMMVMALTCWGPVRCVPG